MDRGAWWATLYGVTKSQTKQQLILSFKKLTDVSMLSDSYKRFYFVFKIFQVAVTDLHSVPKKGNVKKVKTAQLHSSHRLAK